MVNDADKIKQSYLKIGEVITTETPKVKDTLEIAKASIEATGAGIKESNKKAGNSQKELTKVTTTEVSKAKESYQSLKKEVKDTGTAISEAGETTEQANAQMSDGGSIAQAMANHWNGLKNEMATLSPAALEAYEGINQVGEADVRTLTNDVDALKKNLEQASEELQEMGFMFQGTDATGLGRWMYDTKKASLEVKETFLEQKIAFEELMQAYESGELTAESFAGKARKAAEEMDLLDQQDMDTLNRALEQAERRMDSLKNSTRSTLENLQNELDRLEGNTEAIERRRFEARKRDLEAQLKEARKSGDGQAVSNLERALSLNTKVFSKTKDQRKDREREERRKERQSSSPQRSQPQTSPSKVIRLEYAGGAVDVNVRQGDEGKLLRALQIAGGRAI